MEVAVLGLGIIGSAWARNLIEDGHDVRAWNRSPKDFPNVYKTARSAVDGAKVVIIVVSDPTAVSAVLDQIEPVLGPGQIVIQSSTISAEWTRRFADRVEICGAAYLDAPFTGSKPAAEARKTVFYLGGDEAVIESVKPLLKPLSQTILRIGHIGAASSLKLAMNVNIAGVGIALAESLSIARHAGISDEIFFKALRDNAGRSGFSDLKEPKLRDRDYSPQFSVKHMLKDLKLALETAYGLPLSALPAIIGFYERGAKAGMADDDIVGLARLVDPKA